MVLFLFRSIRLLIVLGMIGGWTLSVAMAQELKVGMVAALSGPASVLGLSMKRGIEAYFQQINAEGGVNGHIIRLIALDDGYEPERAGLLMKRLIQDEGVLAVIGNVGTPTAVVTVPIANQEKTLLFGAYTGAGLLRKSPPDRYVINFRASYAEEMANMVYALLSKGIKPEEIAFFTQNDSFGDSGYQGAVTALKVRGFSDTQRLAHGRYPRNTTDVEAGLAVIRSAPVKPKAVLMVGVYKPCAAFIRLARKEFPDAIFMNLSFVGSMPLAKELGADGEGVVVTQVVPHFDAALLTVERYRQAMHKLKEEPEFISLEGWIVASLFVEGVRRVGSTALTRESIIDGIEAIRKQDIGIGIPLSFSATIHQASRKVWPTMIRGGKFVPLEWKSWSAER